ncbi:hypothetical protein H696_01450 [Fonticula alba]|uniref:SH3 domain-containing protein n=1 Tax=Fonticula alba TaxID=691883 RepID=A0A058ZEZ1_FONAL|nr:hypothetical protein H696_01450 [Fonticula alba]KCV72042.1 hypothetical protein H696_01450 [Fonticula alba]|eukprot:XP_009493620.1 hypothetical protein H696_01450 [Fonticula alba]
MDSQFLTVSADFSSTQPDELPLTKGTMLKVLSQSTTPGDIRILCKDELGRIGLVYPYMCESQPEQQESHDHTMYNVPQTAAADNLAEETLIRVPLPADTPSPRPHGPGGRPLSSLSQPRNSPIYMPGPEGAPPAMPPAAAAPASSAATVPTWIADDESTEARLPLPIPLATLLVYFPFGVFGALFFLLLETKNDFIRYHAWQCMIISGALLVLQVIFIWTFIGSVIIAALQGATILVLGVVCMVGSMVTPVRTRVEVPGVSNLARTMLRKDNKPVISKKDQERQAGGQ